MWRSNTGGFITAEHRSKKVVSKGIEWQDNKTLLISLFRRKTEFYFNKLNDRGHKNNACVNCRPKPTLALCEQESENRKRPSWALGLSCFQLPITSLYFQLTGTSEVFIFNGCHWDKTSKKKSLKICVCYWYMWPLTCCLAYALFLLKAIHFPPKAYLCWTAKDNGGFVIIISV